MSSISRVHLAVKQAQQVECLLVLLLRQRRLLHFGVLFVVVDEGDVGRRIMMASSSTD